MAVLESEGGVSARVMEGVTGLILIDRSRHVEYAGSPSRIFPLHDRIAAPPTCMKRNTPVLGVFFKMHLARAAIQLRRGSDPSTPPLLLPAVVKPRPLILCTPSVM